LDEKEGLLFLEPYQPGKIPVIFVHGLLAEPSHWFDMAGYLRNQPWFSQHFQIWFFKYAAGEPFLSYAAKLRGQSGQAVDMLDPEATDHALRNMVLIGHSMGGMICKLQVTDSEDRIWKSFANTPLEAIQADEPVKCRLAELCFFEHQPFVRRVIFLATPHRGDSWSSRAIGHVVAAAILSNRLPEPAHAQLISANPGVFSPIFERRIPISLDLIKPDDPTLQAILSLPVSADVELHSIIGTGRATLLEGPGDGVVPVSSARLDGVASERFVDAWHMQIQHNAEVAAEVRRILWEHLIVWNMQCQAGPSAGVHGRKMWARRANQ
jgi:pimeloyl-ACP methyl ester carboxylesterase